MNFFLVFLFTQKIAFYIFFSFNNIGDFFKSIYREFAYSLNDNFEGENLFMDIKTLLGKNIQVMAMYLSYCLQVLLFNNFYCYYSLSQH